MKNAVEFVLRFKLLVSGMERTLKNMLGRTKLHSIETEGSSTTCNGKRCDGCNHVKTVNSFGDKNNKKHL